MSVSQYLKALVAGLIAGLSVLGGAVGDGVSAEEWITTAVAFLSGLGITYLVPNRAPSGSPASPDLSEQDGRDLGYADAGYLIVGVLVLLVVLWAVGVIR